MAKRYNKNSFKIYFYPVAIWNEKQSENCNKIAINMVKTGKKNLTKILMKYILHVGIVDPHLSIEYFALGNYTKYVDVQIDKYSA